MAFMLLWITRVVPVTVLVEEMLMTHGRIALFVVVSLLVALRSIRLPTLYNIIVVVFRLMVPCVNSPFRFTVVLAISMAPLPMPPIAGS